MIKVQCVVSCDECQLETGMTIEVEGEIKIGDKRALMVERISLPEGWETWREDHYYGRYDDKTLCCRCYEKKKAGRW